MWWPPSIPTSLKPTSSSSSLPSPPPRPTQHRELEGRAVKSGGDADREPQKLLAPADAVFKKLAIAAADVQVSFDIYALAQGHLDVASLAVLPSTTGGQLYYYPSFAPPLDAEQLTADLRWNVSRPQGLEAVLRLRCSTGLSVVDYAGSFAKRTATDVDLPAVDCDKAITVSLRHDDKLPDGAEVAFQCALLYTTADGARRIRVHTLSLPVSSAPAALFRGADLDAQFAALLRATTASLSSASASLATAREASTAHCVNLLAAYRKHCAAGSSAGQLILPEALKLLPLYTLAMHKALLASGGSAARPDERAAALSRAAWLPPAGAIALVYPRLYEVHKLVAGPAPPPGAPLPPTLSLSSEKLDPDGVFLLENGQDGLVWVGKLAPPEMLLALFGVETSDALQGATYRLSARDNPASERFLGLLNAVRAARKSELRVRVLHRGDPLEALFHNSLAEDRLPGGASYVEFLCAVHRAIQAKFQAGN